MLLRNGVLATLDPPRVAAGDLRVEDGALGEQGPSLSPRPGEEGGDLMGEAFLAEAGITTNGVLVDRYEITLDNVDPEDAAEYESFTEAYIDIARDGGYLVRLVMNGTGFNNSFTVDQTAPRDITYELNFSEFGEISEFTTPEGCQA